MSLRWKQELPWQSNQMKTINWFDKLVKIYSENMKRNKLENIVTAGKFDEKEVNIWMFRPCDIIRIRTQTWPEMENHDSSYWSAWQMMIMAHVVTVSYIPLQDVAFVGNWCYFWQVIGFLCFLTSQSWPQCYKDAKEMICFSNQPAHGLNLLTWNVRSWSQDDFSS